MSEISLTHIVDRISKVEGKVDVLCGDMKDIKNNHLQAIYKKLNGRPTWSVAIIITLLSSLCVGLIVKMLILP